MLNVFELDRLEVFSKQTYGSCNRSILDGMNAVLEKAFGEYTEPSEAATTKLQRSTGKR